MLAAMGVDSHQHGTALHFMPMTDSNILKRSNGEIQKASLVRAKDLAEEKGGLFDVGITGGLKGTKWGHIELGRKIPHPLYEKVIKDLLDMKTSDYLGLIGQTRHYNPDTQAFSDQPGSSTVTGEAAFRELLDFDPKERYKETQIKARTASGSDLNRINRAARYLKGLQDSGFKPFDAYMVSKIPVIPPQYRPVIEQRNGGLRVADANLLYRDVVLTKDTLQRAEAEGSLPTEDMAKARVSLYDAYGALVGVGKSLTHRRDADLRGFVDIIKGKNNKEGLFQQQLARRRNDYTGRSTIEPDATLGPDEIAIPEDMAWKIYQPAIVRRMAQLGWKPAEALKEVEKRGLVARNALDQELRTRPVLYNRAPSLHRWSVIAAMPKITAGKEIKISPFVEGALNSDHDGDTVSVYAPLTDRGMREAHDLLPSRNLFYDKDRSLAFAVDKDVVTGLFALTRRGTNSGKSYDTRQDAIAAYQNNKDGLRMDSLVMISEEKNQGLQAIGWLIFETIVPPRFLTGIGAPIDGKKLATVLDRIAKDSPADFNTLGRKIQMAGFSFAARAGGIGGTVQELAIDRTKINALLNQIDKAVKQGKGIDEKRKLALESYAKVKPGIDAIISDHLDTVGLGGSVFLAAKPSSKLGMDSYRQMVASPVMVNDSRDRAIPSVIKSSYGSGMLLSDYIMTAPGARSGMVDKGLSVAGPGFLTKELAGNLGPVRVGEKDCGTTEGIQIPLDPPEGVKQHDADLLDRHLLNDVPGTSFRRNDVVTPAMLSALRDKKLNSVMVRSPMTCQANSPPCQMCAGRTPDGKLHPIGANIGYNYGLTIGERSTQTILKKFHTGGTVGSGPDLADGFARLRELLSAPESVKGQGTLSDIGGTIASIKSAPQGGHYIQIRPTGQAASNLDTSEHYVLPGRNISVVNGEKVERGDRLSDGSYRPQEIAEKKGLLAAQSYVVDEMRKAFQSAGAVVRKPVLEVAVAAMMRFMRVTQDGGEKDLVVGDVLPEQEFKKRQLKNPKLQGVPELPGLSHVPLVRSNDMLERLNFQRLEDTLREIPASGGISDLSGSKSPIPGFAYGAAFRPGQASFELTKDRTALGDSAFNRLAHFT
jgi:DNA-directed RNA polymerase subunit beta'